MSRNSQAYVLAAFAILFWSSAASAFKITLRYLDYQHILLYASLISTFILFLIIIISGKFTLLKQTGWKSIRNSIGLGFLNPFLYYLILLKAYTLLPGQLAQPLNFIWPIMIVLFSIPLLKNKVSSLSLIALLISFGGVVLIASKGDFTNWSDTNLQGVFLALSSSVIWALFFILNLKDPRDVLVKMMFNFFFGFIYILVFVACFAELKIPDIRGLGGSIYIGIFEMGITFVLWLKALEYSRTSVIINNFIYITPFMSMIYLSLFVKERILASSIIGLILIVVGIILQKLLARRS